MAYFGPIKEALLTFPFIAFIITLPYILSNYHKYGSILLLRCIIVYSFVLYLISAYFLVILPLPSLESVGSMTTKLPQLIPFDALYCVIKNSNLDISNINSLKGLITNPDLFQIIFNMFLTLPFGVYLRYYFKCSFKKTLLYSFLLALFFELTQLTGLYFIYPKAYRLFDVDDLIINTTGGLLGYAITPLFQIFLPTRKQLELTSYKKGKNVSFFKRLVAFLIDIIIWMIITGSIYIFISLEYLGIITLIIYFIIIPILTKGATPGKKFVNIKLVNNNDEKPKFYQYIIRSVLLFGILLPSPLYIIIGIIELTNMFNDTEEGYLMKLIIVVLGCAIIFMEFLVILIHNVIMNKIFLYELISKTKNKSTIELPEELKNIDTQKDESKEEIKDEQIEQTENIKLNEEKIKVNKKTKTNKKVNTKKETK